MPMSTSFRSRTQRWRLRASPVLAVLLATTCAGCASNLLPAPLHRELPPADKRIFAPVGDPSARLRDDARERLARTRDALKEANDRLEAGRAWYDGVRQSYGGEGAK